MWFCCVKTQGFEVFLSIKSFEKIGIGQIGSFDRNLNFFQEKNTLAPEKNSLLFHVSLKSTRYQQSEN